MQTTKYTEHTKPTGCEQTRGYTKSAAAVGGYRTQSFVCLFISWFLYFGASPDRTLTGPMSPDGSRGEVGPNLRILYFTRVSVLLVFWGTVGNSK